MLLTAPLGSGCWGNRLSRCVLAQLGAPGNDSDEVCSCNWRPCGLKDWLAWCITASFEQA